MPPTNRVTVTLTHAQVRALRRLVQDAEAADVATTRWLTAAQITERTKAVRSARAAVDRMDAATDRQEERRAHRHARQEKTVEGI